MSLMNHYEWLYCKKMTRSTLAQRYNDVMQVRMALDYLYRMEEGRFPYSSKLGERSVAWVESEVQEWIEQRIRYKAWSDCNIELAKAVSIVNKEKKRRCEHCGCVKEKDNHEKGAR